MLLAGLLSTTVNLWMIGSTNLQSGSSKYTRAAENVRSDPSELLIDQGIYEATFGISLLSLSIIFGLIFLSAITVRIRKKALTK